MPKETQNSATKRRAATAIQLFSTDCEKLLDRKVREAIICLLARRADLAQAERDLEAVIEGL